MECGSVGERLRQSCSPGPSEWGLTSDVRVCIFHIAISQRYLWVLLSTAPRSF